MVKDQMSADASGCSAMQVQQCMKSGSIEYCAQGVIATIDSGTCCPSCKPVCQGAPSPFAIEDDSHKNVFTQSMGRLFSKPALQDWTMPWSTGINGFSGMSGAAGVLKCNGGGADGGTPNGGAGGSGGPGGGNGGSGGTSSGGNGGNGNNNGNGGNGNNGGSGGSNSGGQNNNNNGGAASGTCTDEQNTACNAAMAQLPTCAAGQKPTYDPKTCCIDCIPAATPSPSVSLDMDDMKYNCTEGDVKKCLLKIGFCNDTENVFFAESMCCKSCKRPELACSPAEVAQCMASTPDCAMDEKPFHMSGACCMTCNPLPPVCNPECGDGETCVLNSETKLGMCKPLTVATVKINGGGKTYQELLSGMSKKQLKEYLTEVVLRYCENPQVVSRCADVINYVEVMSIKETTASEDQNVFEAVLELGECDAKRPPEVVLVAALSNSNAVAGDGASKLKVSASSATTTVAGVSMVAIGAVVLVLAVAGGAFLLHKRRKAAAAHSSNMSHVTKKSEVAMTTA
jgi:hypothetical protein